MSLKNFSLEGVFMTLNLPERPLRALKRFPGLLMNAWPSLWEDENDFFPEELQTRGMKVFEEDNHLHVEAPMPGLNPKDIQVSLNNGVLQIKGESKEEERDKKRKFYRSSHRSYSFSLVLPTQIDEKIEPQANYENGILDVTMQLTKQGETKKIEVKAGNNNKKKSAE
jgi:HSP20 family protein